ncbi:MAG: SIS domain-containing protein [Nocardioidaceae bacterium]
MTAATPSAHVEAEMVTQPANWLAAGRTVSEYAALFPRRGERTAVVGCGTSLFMAQSYAAMREASGQGVTDAWPASEARLDREYDRVVAITRSGTTTEIVELLQSIRGRVPATVIVATPGTPVVELADAIVTPEVDERAIVQTRFATATLAMLRKSLGDDLTEAARQAELILAADESSLGPALDADQITFVGRGWTTGLANEAALKLRETAQLWTEAYPMMEYRHGPISISRPGRVVWALGEPVPDLARDVMATGAAFEHADVDPMAELVRVHRLCVVRARAEGLNPDEPRNLTRSVMLKDSR